MNEKRTPITYRRSTSTKATCGQCAEWLRIIPGRRKEDGESGYVCLKGGQLVTKDTPADEDCFTNLINVE